MMRFFAYVPPTPSTRGGDRRRPSSPIPAARRALLAGLSCILWSALPLEAAKPEAPAKAEKPLATLEFEPVKLRPDAAGDAAAEIAALVECRGTLTTRRALAYRKGRIDAGKYVLSFAYEGGEMVHVVLTRQAAPSKSSGKRSPRSKSEDKPAGDGPAPEGGAGGSESRPGSDAKETPTVGETPVDATDKRDAPEAATLRVPFRLRRRPVSTDHVDVKARLVGGGERLEIAVRVGSSDGRATLRVEPETPPTPADGKSRRPAKAKAKAKATPEPGPEADPRKDPESTTKPKGRKPSAREGAGEE